METPYKKPHTSRFNSKCSELRSQNSSRQRKNDQEVKQVGTERQNLFWETPKPQNTCTKKVQKNSKESSNLYNKKTPRSSGQNHGYSDPCVSEFLMEGPTPLREAYREGKTSKIQEQKNSAKSNTIQTKNSRKVSAKGWQKITGKLFVCSFCSLCSFSSSEGLAGHVSRVHRKQREKTDKHDGVITKLYNEYKKETTGYTLDIFKMYIGLEAVLRNERGKIIIGGKRLVPDAADKVLNSQLITGLECLISGNN